MPQTFYMKSIHGGMQRSIKENVMTQYRYKKPLLAIVAALPISSALAASATPASARDVGPVIAGALGGFAAGAIIGSTMGHGGYYPTYSSGYYDGGYYKIQRRCSQNRAHYSRNALNGPGNVLMIGHRKWREHSSQTLWCVRRPPCEDLAAREHGRRDAAALVKFGENHRDEVERN